MKKRFVSKVREQQLRLALDELKIASTRIYESASGEKPFKISKLLNVMGKVTYDYTVILSMLLGDREVSASVFATSFDSPPLSIFKAFIEDLKEEGKIK